MRGERGRAGRWTVGRAVRESGRTGARRRTLRRGTDGRARASKKAARSTRDRQTWDGRTARSADYTWVLADFHQYKGCDTYCTRQVHMVHGSWSMGMRADAHTGPLNCLGMGGTWVLMGNAHGKANWTVNVQAGMCTRVANVVSALFFLLNCALGGTGQTCMGWAWGFCTFMDGTDARPCVALRSSVSSASTDGTVAPALDGDCRALAPGSRAALVCAPLNSDCSSALCAFCIERLLQVVRAFASVVGLVRVVCALLEVVVQGA